MEELVRVCGFEKDLSVQTIGVEEGGVFVDSDI